MAAKAVKTAFVIVVAALAIGVRRDHAASGSAVGALAESSVGACEPEMVCRFLEEAGADGYVASFDLLESPAAEVRAGAALFLGRRRSRLAVESLVRLLRDGEPLVRRSAAEALGLIGERRALPFLERALRDPDPATAEAALLAARRLRAPRPEAADESSRRRTQTGLGHR